MAALEGKGYSMSVWQYGHEQTSFGDVYRSGEGFSVVWYYTPDAYENAAGARNRQVITQTFAARTGFINVIGAMRKLREQKLLQRQWVGTPELADFLGID